MSPLIAATETAIGTAGHPGLAVGGLTPLTTVDFPDRLAAVVFVQGCPWRCPYCHNPHLLDRNSPLGKAWDDVLDFLDARVGWLDGVVFSGGEPLAQRNLAKAVAEVRGKGFETALHTAGPNPERLSRVLPLLDWVGFDVKTAFVDYQRITGVPRSGDAARESLSRLIASGVPYEVRMTLDPSLTDGPTIRALAADLRGMGVRRFVVQPRRWPSGHARPEPESPLRDPVLMDFLDRGFPSFAIR